MSSADNQTYAPRINPSEFYNSIVEKDAHPAPKILKESRPYAGGSYHVAVEKFTSVDYHNKEVERLWKRVWQVACREEEIPEVGDIYVYEIATFKFIIVRTAPDKIKAYVNACLHRGRQLVDCDSHASQLRCPFHGFTWDLEGRIAAIPCASEFSHIEDSDYWRLPEAKVGRWGGFVFINPDTNAAPLEDFLGDFDRHFARYPLQDRYIAGHARRILSCNWKVAQDAFLETYHVLATHPQVMLQGAQMDFKNDIYEHYTRATGAYYVQNPFLSYKVSDQDILDSISDLRMDQERTLKLKEGYTARQQMVEMARANYERVTGESADRYSDSEMVDISALNLFPNFGPWSLFNRICYLFRPYLNDPNKSIMDVYQLMPFDKKKGRPPAAKVHVLSEDEDWTAAPEIGVNFARVANQDLHNLGAVQIGLKTTARKVINFTQSLESRNRHFHDLLEKWVG